MATVTRLSDMRATARQKALPTVAIDSSDLDRAQKFGKKPTGDFETRARVYNEVDSVFALTDLICANLARVPLVVESQDPDGSWEAAPDSSLAVLLRVVNEGETWRELLFAAILDLLLTGNAYWLMEYSPQARAAEGKLPPSELYWAPSYRMTVIPGAERLVDGYAYRSSAEAGKGKRFEWWEVLHFKTHNPQDRFYGTAPLAPLVNPVEIIVHATTWMRSFFRHQAQPGIVLTTDKALGQGVTPKDLKATVEEFKDVHKGSGSAFKTRVLTAGMKIDTYSLDPDKVQALETETALFTRMARTLKVPPMIAGIYESGNRALAEAQERAFWRNCIQAWASVFADERGHGTLNEKFVGMWAGEGTFRCRWDWTVVGALLDEEIKRATAAKALIGSMTLNEVRAKYHEAPPLQGGDIIWDGGRPVAWTEEAEEQALRMIELLAPAGLMSLPPARPEVKALPPGDGDPFGSTRRLTGTRRSRASTSPRPT